MRIVGRSVSWHSSSPSRSLEQLSSEMIGTLSRSNAPSRFSASSGVLPPVITGQ